MSDNTPKPVDAFLLENTAIDGTHYAKGTILRDLPGELALDLAQQNKVRLATPEDFAAAESAAAAAAAEAGSKKK